MRVFYRYIIREAAAFFSISLFAFTAILLTLKMLQFATLIVDKGVEPLQILQVFVAIIPTFLEIAIPLATLLGIMLAFARLSGDSEIIVIRGSGVSLYQLVGATALCGLAAGCAGLIVAHHLKPWGYQKLSRTLFEIARTKSTSGLEEGIFNKLGALTLYAEQIDDSSGNLQKVLIEDRRNKESRQIITAKGGIISSNEKQRTITFNLHHGYIHEIIGGKYVLTDFITNSVTFDSDELFDAGKSSHGKQTNEMSYDELKESLAYHLELLERTLPGHAISAADFDEPRPAFIVPQELPYDALKRKVLRTRTEIGQRFSLPFASFALALLALPLGIQPPRTQRTWGAGLSASLGMIVFVFYYGLSSIGLVLAQGDVIHPFAALWLPNMCVLGVAVYMIHKTASEKWQSVAQGFEDMIKYLLLRLRIAGAAR